MSGQIIKMLSTICLMCLIIRCSAYGRCLFNQVEAECASPCQPNCIDYVQDKITWGEDVKCIRMCLPCKCEGGLYVDSDDKCVAPNHCGCYDSSQDEYFKIGETFFRDDEQCRCNSFRSFTCTGSGGSGYEI